ncbi:MAG: sensor histidine kinase, partial [Roseovarius sp.]
MSKAASSTARHRMRTISWRARAVLFALFAVAVAVVLTTNRLLTDRFTENTRNRAELRLVLYSGNLLSELRQNAIVPQLLARDPALIAALNTQDYAQSTQRLISFLEEIGAASLTLLDRDGRAVAATDRLRLGESHKAAAYFVDAMRSRDTIFHVLR